MRGKFLFVVGLATGYVLGTRAGRERYEQIKAGAEKVWNTPVVQSGVHSVQDFAGSRVDAVKADLSQKARNALAALIGRDPLTKPEQSSSRPSTAKPASAGAAAAAPAKPKPVGKTQATKPDTAPKAAATKKAASAAGADAADTAPAE
ncbi:YtxH domain-containing protein [Herbiconiux sp. 11R-BC]|uniref:YtxH domain-containing protein n=1 Tax=Herbiconiux sp. 11R-BC TaxID=3111637 RepID=UPI003C10F10B